jgi:hypothetical protein
MPQPFSEMVAAIRLRIWGSSCTKELPQLRRKRESLTYPHTKKSHMVRSGYLGGQRIRAWSSTIVRPIQLWANADWGTKRRARDMYESTWRVSLSTYGSHVEVLSAIQTYRFCEMCQRITNNSVCVLCMLYLAAFPIPCGCTFCLMQCIENLILWSCLLRKVVLAFSFGWKNSSDQQKWVVLLLLLKQIKKCLNG